MDPKDLDMMDRAILWNKARGLIDLIQEGRKKHSGKPGAELAIGVMSRALTKVADLLEAAGEDISDIRGYAFKRGVLIAGINPDKSILN